MASLFESVRYLRGVGETRAKLFASVGIVTLYDLICWFPRAYEDRSRLIPVADLQVDEPACFRAIVASHPRTHHIRQGLDLTRLIVADETGRLTLTFFNQKYAAENLEGAKKAWEESLKAAPSAWAYRNLAMLEKNEWGHIGKAEELMDEAMRIGPRFRVLCVEYAMTLLAAEHYEKWLACFDTLPAELKANGRLRLYRAIALMRLKRFEEAAEIINEDFEMVDIKEGELSVSHLWFELYEEIYALRTGKRDAEAAREAYPLPKKLDFRMI